MTLPTLLDELLRRFQAAGTGELLIGSDAVQGWPDGALEALQTAGLLLVAQPASSLICPGCEEACPMPVQLIPGSHPRAYIVCDHRNDVGRVPVDLAQLAQWQITEAALIRVLSAASKPGGTPESTIQDHLRHAALPDLFQVRDGQIEIDPMRLRQMLHPTVAADHGNHFALTGDHWSITYQGQSFTLANTLGLRYIGYLLQHQGKEIHVRDLYYAINPPDSGTTDPTLSAMTGDQLGELGLKVSDLGDAGDTMTPEGRKRIEAELRRLQEQIDEEAELGNEERQSELEAQQEQILSYLAAETGLDGRSRKASSEVERIRKAVTKRIQTDIKKIGQYHTLLGHHLTTQIQTGTQCRYAPKPTVEWVFSNN